MGAADSWTATRGRGYHLAVPLKPFRDSGGPHGSQPVALEGLPLPKLDCVDLVTVKLPFVAPFGTSVYTWTHKEALLMRLESSAVNASFNGESAGPERVDTVPRPGISADSRQVS